MQKCIKKQQLQPAHQSNSTTNKPFFSYREKNTAFIISKSYIHEQVYILQHLSIARNV